MDTVLTLISPAPLAPAALRAVCHALESLGGALGAPDFLSETACDIPFTGLHPDQADAAARQALGHAKIDLIAQPMPHRRKRLLVADMESTIIQQEMLDELAALVGARDRVSDITRRAMNGEIDFVGALEERVALLKGLPAKTLEILAVQIKLMPGADLLIPTMKAHGAACWLVSGGFTAFTACVRDRLGFDVHRGNVLCVDQGRLTGRVAPPILDKNSKLQSLEEACQTLSIPQSESLAVGDGANDVPMLLGASLGIAYHAKPTVAATARYRIDHSDLTALLYAQGYRQTEFVSLSFA
jgi:phosphoserine phosphatase